MEQGWSTDPQKVVSPNKRQRLESSQLDVPLLPSFISPPLFTITVTIRPKHLPQLGSNTLGEFTIINVPHEITAGRLKYFSQNWTKLTDSNWILNTSKGYEIPLISPPPLSVHPPSKWSTGMSQPAAKELSKLAQGGILVPAEPHHPGFYSHTFTIPKKTGEQ